MSFRFRAYGIGSGEPVRGAGQLSSAVLDCRSRSQSRAYRHRGGHRDLTLAAAGPSDFDASDFVVSCMSRSNSYAEHFCTILVLRHLRLQLLQLYFPSFSMCLANGGFKQFAGHERWSTLQ